MRASSSLKHLHDLLIQMLEEITPAELRRIAHLGKQLMSSGLPFIPQEAPLPECSKGISGQLRRVI
jgi:hypothetical protein